MRLQRLHILGFGGVREQTIELGCGITVFTGPNEAGKSTVLSCLAQLLMGKPSQRSLFPDFTPWDGGSFAAELEYEHEGARYRLTRRFSDSGTRAQALHRLLDDGTEQLVTQELPKIREYVTSMLGTGDDRIFYRVFCLSSADLHPLDNYSGLREQLERAASGAEMAVAPALKCLDERVATLRRGVGQPALRQNWGPLKRAEDVRKDWEGRLLEAKRQQRQLTDVRREADTITGQIANGQARLEALGSLLEVERRRRDLQTRLEELKTHWSSAEGERERVEKLTADRDRLRGQQVAWPQALADPQAVRARIAAAEQDGRASFSAGLGVVLIGLMFVAVGGLFVVKNWLGLLPLLIGLALGGYGLTLLARVKAQRGQVAALCAELGVSELAEIAGKLEALERLLRDLDATEMALGAVVNLGELQERRRGLTLEIATVEEKLAQMPGTALGAEDAHRLERERQTLQETLPGLQARERTLQRELAVLEEAERDLVDLEDGAAFWLAEEVRAKEEEATLLLARELLLTAGEQAHSALADPLAERIAPLLSQMTQGRYPQVRVEGDAKSFQVHPLDGAGTPIPPEQLSQGTHDQFILAVRLALGQTIAGDGTPVFLLDDPFLHFDAARRAEALAMLTAFAEQAQILIATHDDTILPGLPEATVVRLGASVA